MMDEIDCPICGMRFSKSAIESHVDACLNNLSADDEPCKKKSKVDDWNQFFKRANSPKVDSLPKRQQQQARTERRELPRINLLESENEDDDEELENVASVDESVGNKAFEESPKTTKVAPSHSEKVPLAERMRPDCIQFYVGQQKAIGPDSMLRNLIDAVDVPSMILWGPPGCGKTTLAHIIANQCKKTKNTRFVSLSAAACGVKQVKEIVEVAKNEIRLFKRTTILFMDEIHRFNKLQQDTFLQHVENGTITLIGATTENPSFSLNNALLSRCKVFVLEKLDSEDVEAILKRALKHLGIVGIEETNDVQSGAGSFSKTFIEMKAVKTLASLCDGDARTALNGLQMAVHSLRTHQSNSSHSTTIDEKQILEGLQRCNLLYDRAGDEHYNCISALHKSLRGSDASASLYWLARMMLAGEDPLYVARRLIEFASEDVGLADSNALVQAVATYQACHFNGVPACKVNLAQCVVYLARAPKSIEVYTAYQNAEKCISSCQGPLPGVPLHLRNAPTRLMKDLGYGKGYKYNPAFKCEVKQKYFPDEMPEINFFSPG